MMNLLHEVSLIAFGALIGALAARWPHGTEVPADRTASASVSKSDSQRSTRGRSPTGQSSPHTEEARKLADASLAEAEALVSRIAVAGQTDLPGLWEAMQKLPYSSVEQHLAETALFQRWVEIGPSEGLAWLEKSGNSDKIELFAGVWLRSDAAAALPWLEENSGKSSMAELWAAWSGNDAELKGIVEAFSANPSFGTSLKSINRSLTRLAESDPAWAISFFEKLPADSDQRTVVAEALAKGMARRGAEPAFAWAKGLPEGGARDKAMEMALRWGAVKEPERVRELLQEADLPDNALADSRSLVAFSLAKRSLRETLDFVRGLPDQSLGDSSFSSHIALRPDMSLVELHETLTELARTGLKPSLIQLAWQDRDPLPDTAALSHFPGGAVKEQMLKKLGEAAMVSPDYRKVETVAALPPEVRGTLAQAMLSIALQQGENTLAYQYWNLLPRQDLSGLFANFSERGIPAERLDFLQKVIGELPADQQQAVSGRLAASWAYDDPASAAAWAAGLPPSPGQTDAFRGIAKTYAAGNEAAASRWIEAMPPGAMRDAAASGLVTALALDDPSSAFVWARSIVSETERQTTLETLASRWAAHDSDAAAAAMQGAELSAADSAAFAKGISHPVTPP